MTDDTMTWTEDQWAAFTAALAARLRERFGEGELLPIDDRTLFVYRAGGDERYVSLGDTDTRPLDDERGAFYDALVSPSRDFEPEGTETVRVHL